VLRAQLDGRLDEAQIAMAQAVKSASRSHADHEWTTAAASALIWWICILRGNAHVFTACLESYVATRRVAPVLPVFDVLLARSHAELGRSEEACRRLDDFGKKLADLPRSPLALVCACLAAEVCALCGRPEHAALLFSFLEPYAARVAMVGEFLCLGSVQRMLGALAALLGRWDESELCFARALAHARGLRAPILSALVQLEHARALGRHPDSAQRARAPALLDSTALAARQLGLPGVEQQAQRLAEPTADRHSTKARRVGDAVPAPAQLSRN
jgi:hypothetical protein